MFKSNENRVLSEKEKAKILKKLEKQFKGILETMLFDTSDENLIDTPRRIAKAWFSELLVGRYSDEPKVTVFENVDKVSQMVTLKDIEVKSMCSHHFMPFVGKCHISYIPGEKIIGISKLARIVEFFARRAQLQELLTKQIADYIVEKINPLGVAVYISATHTCMTLRGANQPLNTELVTSEVRGTFEETTCRNEFLKIIER